MKIISCEIDTIRVNQRKVALNPDTVAQLVESIQAVGLLQPIGIRADKTLVYGYHRLEACKRLGWTEIPAVIVDTEDLHAQLAELDENLVRNTIEDKILLGELLLQRKQLYEQLYPHAKPEVQRLRGLKQFQDTDNDNDSRDDTVSSREHLLSIPETPTFVQDTAKKVGISERSIQRTLQIAEQIVPDVRDRLRGTPIACSTTELLQLARLEPEMQRRVAEKIVEGHQKTVSDALERIKREERETVRPVLKGVHEGLDIRYGDFREVLADIPDQSVDIILTDPPYPAEYLSLWNDLGIFAARVLKPTGVLLAYSGQLHLPTILSTLTQHLRWWWMCAIRHTGNTGYVVAGGRRIMNQWKPLLVFTPYNAPPLNVHFSDLIDGGGRQKELHNWEQSTEEAVRILQTFGNPNALVVDPFAGSGSFGKAAQQAGMRFIGAEVLKP